MTIQELFEKENIDIEKVYQLFPITQKRFWIKGMTFINQVWKRDFNSLKPTQQDWAANIISDCIELTKPKIETVMPVGSKPARKVILRKK